MNVADFDSRKMARSLSGLQFEAYQKLDVAL